LEDTDFEKECIHCDFTRNIRIFTALNNKIISKRLPKNRSTTDAALHMMQIAHPRNQRCTGGLETMKKKLNRCLNSNLYLFFHIILPKSALYYIYSVILNIPFLNNTTMSQLEFSIVTLLYSRLYI